MKLIPLFTRSWHPEFYTVIGTFLGITLKRGHCVSTQCLNFYTLAANSDQAIVLYHRPTKEGLVYKTRSYSKTDISGEHVENDINCAGPYSYSDEAHVERMQWAVLTTTFFFLP